MICLQCALGNHEDCWEEHCDCECEIEDDVAKDPRRGLLLGQPRSHSGMLHGFQQDFDASQREYPSEAIILVANSIWRYGSFLYPITPYFTDSPAHVESRNWKRPDALEILFFASGLKPLSHHAIRSALSGSAPFLSAACRI